jgi:diguanylate cyclase (GGDEF)-like protein
MFELPFWISLIGFVLLSWLLPLNHQDQTLSIWVSLISLTLILIFFHMIVPRCGLTARVRLAGLFLGIAVIAACSYILEPYNIHTEVFYVTMVAAMGILGGIKISRLASIGVALAQATTLSLRLGITSDSLFFISAQSLFVLLAALITSEFTGVIYGKLHHSERRNRYLSLLLQVGAISSRSPDLYINLSDIAEIIVREAPVTFCKICLLDKSLTSIKTYGAFPARQHPGWQPALTDDFPLEALPQIQHVLDLQHAQVIKVADFQPDDYASDQTCALLDSAQTLCILPLIARGKKLGVILVGEARHWQQAPFDQEKLDILNTLASQVSVSIYNSQLFQESQTRADQLAMLNEVSRAIGSTIDLDALLELIYQQLRKVLASDTYFVALYHSEDKTQDIRILVDQGKRFPPRSIALDQGLASWVIQNRRPLLIDDLAQEQKALHVKPVTIGKTRLSASWLGVPISHGDQVLGILAIASYTPQAFSRGDMYLLENVAAQASLAILNARQFAGVQEEARRDSLTGAYNHGFFQRLLDGEIKQALQKETSLSLIMVDVDHFKEYNDKHGHLVGDEILRQLVLSILAHIKKTDFIGRWGGEEFAIALPGASLEQSRQVAQRFRNSLGQIQVYDLQGQPVGIPTISQGIASFPQDGQNSTELVNSADQALLKAKKSGRDTIVIAAEFDGPNS